MKLTLSTIILCFAALWGWTECRGEVTENMDSVAHRMEISLLTCEPHPAIYSLYGHTAIRVQNTYTGEDFVVNYGMFDFNSPNFLIRFVFGRTDYSMGIAPFGLFCSEYRSYGSGVIQQVLNLTDEEKLKVYAALRENYLPENRVYRYNYFYDNCTTRARDILLNSLHRRIVTTQQKNKSKTYRSMIHEYNEDYPWARWGNDILLGFQSDRRLSSEEQQFLPQYLCNDFEHMQLENSDGTFVPLISKRFYVVRPGVQEHDGGFPLRPVTCALLLLVLTIAVTILEFIKNKWFWLYDTILMIVTGLCGIILTLMIFSSHPTVSLNLQILLFNPLTLIFVFAVTRKARRHEIHGWWKIWTFLILLFLTGRLVQCYAEGMIILALCLLLRCISRGVLRKRLVHI